MKNIFLLLIILFVISCDKPSGEGGTSNITGNITYYTISYNAQTFSSDTFYYPKSGKDVFIIYSDDENMIYDDKTETDWNGNFHFEFLRKGNYTIYTYVDSTVVNDVTYDFPVFKHIYINKNNLEFILDPFIIKN